MAERYRKHVYCEKNFLEHCIKTIAEWQFREESFEELRLWMCIKALIFSSDIVLHLNITFDEIDTIENKKRNELTIFEKNIRDILDRQHQNSDGSPGIKLITRDFVTVDNINKSDNKQLTAYYLTCCDCKTCQKCMDECGVLAICPENLKNFKSILYDNGSAIGKNEQTDWKQKLIFTPCNSLVLVDNYILSDSKGVDNLTKIFEVLLPQKLDSNSDVPFQISIFTTLKKGNAKNDIDSQNCLNKIAISVEKLRPDLYFKLAIFKCSFEKFHDRIIITNNTYISCGGGFDLMNDGKSEKATTLNYVFPFFYKSAKWDSMAYSNFLNSVKGNYDKATEFRADYLTGFYVGNKKNRLIE
jgi:hypothetical protein